MNSKLLIGLVVAMFACCAQAGLEKFGDLGTGEEGFYKHCFTRMSLGNLIGAYYKQKVGDLLGRDRNELDTKIDKEFSEYGDSYDGCSAGCYSLLVKKESASVLPGEKELDETRCGRLAKFQRQCELAQARESSDAVSVATTEWLCETSKQLRDKMHESYFKCQEDPKYPEVYRRIAEKSFVVVTSASLEDLEEAKKNAAIGLAESDRQRKEFDDKFIEEAYSKVNKGIELLPQYIECSKKEKIDDAKEREYIARKKIENAHQWQLHAEADRIEAANKKRDDEMATLGLLALAALSGR